MDQAFDSTIPQASSAAVQQLTPNSSASDEQNRAPAPAPRVVASCDLCRRRKVKCDRGNPCSNCLRSGATCVSSTTSRVPRGRKGGRRKPDAELLKRIAKLENLVKNLESDNDGVTPAVRAPKAKDVQPTYRESDIGNVTMRQAKSPGSTHSSPKDNLDRYLGSSFWIALSDEISGLREVLNDSSEDELDDEDSKHVSHPNKPVPKQETSSNFVIMGPGTLGSTNSALHHPSVPQVHALCSVFLSNSDRVFKVLHGPSLKRYLYREAKDLDCSPGPRGWEALEFAIYYAATTTLTAEQCMKQIGEERSTLLIRYRSSVELALARADFVNTVELSTLQALVIFLVSVRSNDTTRFTWTMTSLAIRIANALGLHREESFVSLSPFQKEMRRRLWWQIFILDEQGAQDRASDPIITQNSYNTRMPLHVNDEDLTAEGLEEPKERDEFTDMTFSSICQEVTEACILLNFVSPGQWSLVQKDVAGPWDQRRDLVINTQRRIQEKFLRHCDLTIPFHSVTYRVADIIIATLWLLLYRPLRKQVSYATSLQSTHPNILHLSVEVMEKAYQLNLDATAEPVRWLKSNYTQWHSLAITLAELCIQTEGPTVERAWRAVDAMFAWTEQIVADSNTGLLWSPIRKLARRARIARQQHLQTLSAGPLDNHFAVRGTAPMTTQLPISSMVDRGPGAMDARRAIATQQDFPSSSAPAFDWNSWLQPDGLGVEMNLGDTNQMAWANWEGFVDDLYGPVDWMQGQEDGFPAPSNVWYP